MKVNLKPGKYVVAVSGGVDSVVLLDLLSKLPGLQLTVAHFDHGIRQESADDLKFVQALAQKYGYQFQSASGELGPKASEATARKARYEFLESVRDKVKARAIITAHHQDDLLETAILNILRGTNRKGLTSLRSREGLVRPLLEYPKTEIINYAQTNNLKWHEDITNQDPTYLRNYIRHNLIPKMSAEERGRLLNIFSELTITNDELDGLLASFIKQDQPNKLDRQWFNQLPHAVAKEVMAAWLRANNRPGFDRKTLERLVIAAKTGQTGRQFPIQGGLDMQVQSDHLALVML